MVIVTQNQYILASKIHHITMDENVDFIEIRNNQGKNVSYRNASYNINVYYSSESSNNNNGLSKSGDDWRECSVTIRGAMNAHRVFKDLIQQIREQLPDQLYLDKALERMLAGTDTVELAKTDEYDRKSELVEVKNDRKPKAVRLPRKTKRRDQKILRKLKRGRSRR